MRQRLILAFVGLAMLIAGGVFAAVSADEGDQSYLASLISQALSTPQAQVRIGRLDGALSSDATLHDLTISDSDGVWLKLDKARLVWTRSALFQRRLQIDKLEVGKLEILRKPKLAADAPPSSGPLLPEPPVEVAVKDFSLADLALGKDLLGVAGEFSAAGGARLGSPSQGLELRLDAKRLDAPGGSFSINLTYVPQGQSLALAVKFDEPAGGFLGKIAKLPGEPPIKFDIDGKGTLDAFSAGVNFDAGPTIGANGSVKLAREGGVRHLVLDVDSRIAGLLPPPAAPVFAGKTALKGDVTFPDDGGISLNGFSVASQVARLDVSGTLDAARNADFRIKAAAIPSASGSTKAAETEIRKLVFDGTVKGPLTGPTINASLDLEDARTPKIRLGKLAATFTAAPSGAVTDAQTRIALDAKAEASGVVIADPALARAFGDRFSFALHGTAAPDGGGDYDFIRASTATAEMNFKGRAGPAEILGRLAAKVPDLARFGDIAGVRLAGAANLALDLSGSPSKGTLAARIDGSATRLSTGIAIADRLTGGAVAASGVARMLPGGGYGFDVVKLAGRHAAFTLNGQVKPDIVALLADIDIPELRYADERLTGKGAIAAKVSGSTAHPNVHADITLADATAIGRSIPRFSIDAELTDLLGALSANAKLDGIVDGKPAAGSVHVTRLPQGGWQVDGLDVTIGSASLKGALTLDAAALATGHITFAGPRLDDLSPLALTKLGGSLEADIALDATDGKQGAKVTLRGSQVKAAGAAIADLDLSAAIADLYGRPRVDANLTIDRAVFAGQSFTKIRAQSKSGPAGDDITASATALGFDLAAKARLTTGDPMRIELASFEARRGGRAIRLAQPATLTLADGGVDIARLVLAVESGRLSVDGRAGKTLDLRVGAKAVPLSAVEIFAPGLKLAGTLDASATIAGTASAPTGQYHVAVARLVVPQLAASGAPPLDIKADGRLEGGRASTDAVATIGRFGSVRVRGTAPLGGQGALDLTAAGRLDTAITNSVLGPAGRRLTGTAIIDMQVKGTPSKPQLSGNLSLSNGSFDDFLLGVRLTALQLRVGARGDRLTIDQARASTPNGGSISASGEVRIDPAAGFPGTIHVTGQRAELVSNSFLTLVADLGLDLSGPLARDPRIAGDITIRSMDVSIAERLPSSVRPIGDTRHVRPPRQVAARLAAQRKAAAAKASRAAAFNATLAITVRAPGGNIAVHGRGLTAALGGQLVISGTLAKPVPVGAFDLRRGDINVIGNNLDIKRGRVTFSGDFMPDLDFQAEARAGDVTAMIGVTGTAQSPVFTFSSQPELPQDEILSRILFAKASGSLTAFQAIQLAEAASEFSNGSGPFERLRKSLGLGGGNGGLLGALPPSVSRRIHVGVQTGATPGESGLTLDFDVTKHVRVRGEADANGATAVGIGTEFEY